MSETSLHDEGEAPAPARVSPLDGKPLEPVASSSEAEVRAAVTRARAAQAEWRRLSHDERVDVLTRAAKRLLERRTELLTLVKREAGKLDVDALFTEALGPLDAVKGWARVTGDAVEQKVRLNPLSFPKKKARIDLVPRGVIGVIAPWNYPIAGLYRSLIPALMTGNGVVLKPSEHTPRSSAFFADQLAACLPAGLVEVVHGDGRVGAALVESGVDAIVFTGSTGAGAKVRVRCAELGIPSSIEMGGNDAAIVLADADLDRTTAGITHWALHNAGQACGAIEIVYVDRRVADNFVDKMKSAWERLRTGHGDFAQVDVSPLTTPAQLATVERHVADAIAKGAKRLTGGERIEPGLFYPPTLLDDCHEGMEVVAEETFGPVLAIVRVDGAAEAVRRINEGRYGLGASIWTSDIARAQRLAERIEVGVVAVNNHAMTGAIADLPWSGTRGTGFGVANSALSLSTFCRPRTLLIDESTAPEPFWMPFDPDAWELGDLLSDAQLARIGRAWRLPILLQKRLKRLKRFYGAR